MRRLILPVVGLCYLAFGLLLTDEGVGNAIASQEFPLGVIITLRMSYFVAGGALIIAWWGSALARSIGQLLTFVLVAFRAASLTAVSVTMGSTDVLLAALFLWLLAFLQAYAIETADAR